MAIIKAGTYHLKAIPRLPQRKYCFGATDSSTTITIKNFADANILSAFLATVSGEKIEVISTNIEEDTPYKFCLQAQDGQYYYFTGAIEDNQLQTSVDVSNSIDLYVEKYLVGFRFYFLVDGVAHYINVTNEGAVELRPNSEVAAWYSPSLGTPSYWGPDICIAEELTFVTRAANEELVAAGMIVTCNYLIYVFGSDEDLPVVLSTSWLFNSCRTVVVSTDQEVSEGFIEIWNNNQQQKPADTEIIHFSINGETLEATKNSSWLMWFNSMFCDYRFSTTQDEYVVFNKFMIFQNGRHVNMHDFIVADCNYKVTPQIRFDILTPSGVKFDPLFANRGTTEYLLQANTGYDIQLTFDGNLCMAEQELTYLNEYIQYRISSNQLTILVGDIPDDFMDIELISFRLPEPVSKNFIKLTETTTIFENSNVIASELAPPYMVNIKGGYFLGGDNKISRSIETHTGQTVCGLISPISTVFSLLPNFGQSLSELSSLLRIIPEATLPYLFGFVDDKVTYAQKIYCVDSWYMAYLNHEATANEILGQSAVAFDKDFDAIKRCAISAFAEEESISTEEFLNLLEEQAQAQGVTSDQLLIQMIESEYGASIDSLRCMYVTTIDNASLTELDDLFQYKVNVINNNLIAMFDQYGLTSMTFYTVGSANDVMKNIFTYSSLSAIYPLYNGNENITSNVVYSDMNDFDITSTGEKLNNFNYLEVDKYIAPIDRYTPGTVYVSEQTCFSGDTLIEMSDGSHKRIDQIHIGELVRTIEGSEKVIYADSMMNKQKNNYTDYYFSDNTKLRIIKNHRVYSLRHRKFVHISSLNIGDEILKNNGTTARLTDKKTVCERIAHYTLFTENSNGYYANGILCGNIFSNIKISWLRKMLLKLYSKLVLNKELKHYEKF